MEGGTSPGLDEEEKQYHELFHELQSRIVIEITEAEHMDMELIKKKSSVEDFSGTKQRNPLDVVHMSFFLRKGNHRLRRTQRRIIYPHQCFIRVYFSAGTFKDRLEEVIYVLICQHMMKFQLTLITEQMLLIDLRFELPVPSLLGLLDLIHGEIGVFH